MPKYLILVSALMFALAHNSTAKISNTINLVDSIGIYMTNQTMECGKRHSIDVKVKNFRNVTNFQFSINFNENQLRGDAIRNENIAFENTGAVVPQLQNGNISFSWTGQAVTLPDDAILFTIDLTPYFYGTNGTGQTPISFSSSPTPIQAYTTASTATTFPVKAKSAIITIMDRTPPTAICPQSRFYRGLDSILIANITGLASDDCGSAMITSHSMTGANTRMGPNDANGRFYKLGVTKILYTATDLAGNIAQCPFQIVLVKNTDDTLTIIAGSKLSRCEDGDFMDIGFFTGNANGKNINRFNLSLEFDQSAFNFVSTSNINPLLVGANFNLNQAADGKIGFSWAGPSINLSDNSRLFTLRLKVMGAAGEYKITMGNSPVPKNISSSTLGTLQCRIISGDLIIKDFTPPTIACKRDTLIYEATGVENKIPLLGNVVGPVITDNCAPEAINYTLNGATTAINQVFDAAKFIDFNLGSTTVTYRVTDFGKNTAVCNQKITVNRLQFIVGRDSVPCSTKRVNIPIRVLDFEQIRSLQFELKWNPLELALTPAEILFADPVYKNNTVISGNPASGVLTFSFNYPIGATILIDNSVFMTLPFNLTGKVNSSIEMKVLDAKIFGQTGSINGFARAGSIKNFDTQAPIFSGCPNDIVETISSTTQCSKAVSWIPPTVADNCDVTVSSSLVATKQKNNKYPPNTPTIPGEQFFVGTTIITYKAKDAFGNEATCSFKITINKTIPPVLVCPQDVTLNTNNASCTVPYIAPNPTTTDPCDPELNITNDAPANNQYPIGVTTVTFRSQDFFGNISTCSMRVTVQDKYAPEIICPTNITKPTDTDKDGTNVTWAAPIVLENCSTPVVVSPDIQPNSFFKIGSTNVTYRVSDQMGNSASCSFSVNVIDTQNPKIDCPNAPITVLADPSRCGQTVALPTFSDNSGKMPMISASANIGNNNFYPIGKTDVSITVRDSSGNASTCDFSVVVKDVTPPTLATIPNITIDTDVNKCTGTFPNNINPSVSDACGNTIISVTRTPSMNDFPIGTTLITFTATDQDANTATRTMFITVLDKSKPEIGNCPADITASAEAGKNGAVVNWVAPTASGKCGATATLSPSQAPATFFNIGNTIVTYTATDQNGNTSTCSFNVRVIDTQSPKINCPASNRIDTVANPTTCGQIVTLPTFTDNSGAPANIIAASNVSPNNFYPVGRTQVSFTVSDIAGNTAFCAFTIFVKDVTKPTLNNVKDITLNNISGKCVGKVSPVDIPKANDACNNTNITLKSNPSIDGDFPLGVTTVTFTASDEDGNTQTATMSVRVVDTEPPTLNNCPTKIELSTEPNKNGAIATWTPPTATDNCDVSLTTSHAPNTIFLLGTTVVTYIATDRAGLQSSCSFEVIVKDTEKPVIDCKDIIVGNDAGKCGATITLPKVTDNVNVERVLYNPQPPANNYFEVGPTTNFIMTAADAAGLSAACSFNVRVNDLEAPSVVNCPKDITLNLPSGSCEGQVNPLPIPTFDDNCGASKLIITNNRDSLTNGNQFKVGEPNIVTFYARDAAGRTSTCSYKVLLINDLIPTVFCPSNINVALGINKCDTVITWNTPTAIQGCTPIVGAATSDIPSGAVFKAGITTVNYTVKDKGGLEGKCSFTVNVSETTAPTIDLNTMPKDITLNADADNCVATHTWNVPSAFDQCSAANDITIEKINGPNSGDKLNIGDYTVSYRATDKAGNTAVKSFTIKVEDKSAPKLVCPTAKNLIVNIAGAKIQDTENQIISTTPSVDCKEVNVVFKPLSIIENCSPDGSNPSFRGKFTLGNSTPFVFTYSDKAGNTSTCEVNLEVVDIKTPDISLSISEPSCKDETIQLLTDSLSNTQYEWTGPNGFASSEVSPIVENLSATNAGAYRLAIIQNGCKSPQSKALIVDVVTEPNKGQEDQYEVYTSDELSGNVTTNDTLRSDLTSVVKVLTPVKNGKLTMRNDGGFTYISNQGYVGNDAFTYAVFYENCPDASSAPIAARIIIKPKEAKVPNVITPNGDGFNDTAIIDFPFNGKEKAELYIYNQWGHEVYRAVPYDNSKAWKGTFNNNAVPDGTYYYIFIPDTGYPAQKGFITVLR
jgi:gliding motility-associated-like protein